MLALVVGVYQNEHGQVVLLLIQPGDSA